MVAYGFRDRFRNPILSGLDDPIQRHRENPKRQTIRAGYIDRGGIARRPKGSKHSNPGNAMSLYTGWRTKDCKFLACVRCVSVKPITIWPDSGSIMLGGKVLGPRQLQKFARADGFEDLADFAEFFASHYGRAKFSGVLIEWEPL